MNYQTVYILTQKNKKTYTLERRILSYRDEEKGSTVSRAGHRGDTG